MFLQVKLKDYITKVSVPLRGVGCFYGTVVRKLQDPEVSVPLRGVGCFMAMCAYALDDVFPSPCGVWVVSINARARERYYQFPSPCGVWGVSLMPELVNSAAEFPSPCGVWVVSAAGTMDPA